MPTLGEIQNMKVGVWNYTSGTSGIVDTSALVATNDIPGNDEVRVLSIAVIAGPVDGFIQIDDRETITLPAGKMISLNPEGTIINPVIGFTDTASYVIEFVTNNYLGSSKGNING